MIIAKACGEALAGDSYYVHMINVLTWAKGALRRALLIRTFNWIAFMPIVLFKESPLISICITTSMYIIKPLVVYTFWVFCESMVVTGWPTFVYWGVRIRSYGHAERLSWTSTCLVFFTLDLFVYGQPISKVGLLFPPLLLLTVWQPFLWVRLVLIIQGLLFLFMPHSGPQLLFLVTAILRKLYLVPILFLSSLLAALFMPIVSGTLLSAAAIAYVAESFGWIVLLVYAHCNLGDYDKSSKFGPQGLYFHQEQDYVFVRGAYIPCNASTDVAEHYWAFCFREFFDIKLLCYLYPSEITGISLEPKWRRVHFLWSNGGRRWRPSIVNVRFYKSRIKEWFIPSPLWLDCDDDE